MVTAFIPVRGGSKSIPLKNIRPFCGKPLLWWSLKALQDSPEVDRIVVATDSDEIAGVASGAGFPKVRIYRRSRENATDTASTESVMLEYIHAAGLSGSEIFMLVQATSPLTRTEDFSGALKTYGSGSYDSLLSCVRSYRFFWNSNGTSANYDYLHRPRRQEFEGNLMENGAFYINTVAGILSNGNRLGGRIGIWEMPSWTAFEIDEPDDWTIMEALMRTHVLKGCGGKPVRLFLTDVDGTLTDGGMYYSEEGDELKKFNTRDGMGFRLLREKGILTGIVTSEDTLLVERRAKKLKVDLLVQGKGFEDKKKAVEEFCSQKGITMEEVAYMGDDIGCVPILEAVGHPGCPSDACAAAKAVPGIYVSPVKGGDGCVRDFIEKLL
ncbi:MAG: N-acylneuraminate cytidylyltransferase [Bacteroidales bacterium]|nr:N-acylneuraminate cytidylyltransferase [Bacteroidales bacterium]